MSKEAHDAGIVLLKHPDRLTDADLADLSELCGGVMAAKAPRFCAWLTAWLSDEQDRRVINETAQTPIEATMPRFNACDWTNGDLADALTASFALVRIFSDERRDVLRDFAATTHDIVSAWARHRLRQLPE